MLLVGDTIVTASRSVTIVILPRKGRRGDNWEETMGPFLHSLVSGPNNRSWYEEGGNGETPAGVPFAGAWVLCSTPVDSPHHETKLDARHLLKPAHGEVHTQHSGQYGMAGESFDVVPSTDLLAFLDITCHMGREPSKNSRRNRWSAAPHRRISSSRAI